MGVSRGTLEANSGITEDTTAKFIAIYSDISIEWLLTGEGEMLKSDIVNKSKIIEKEVIVYRSDPRERELLNSKNDIIELQKHRIKSLEDEIAKYNDRK